MFIGQQLMKKLITDFSLVDLKNKISPFNNQSFTSNTSTDILNAD